MDNKQNEMVKFFKSEGDMYSFALLHTDGMIRMDMLGFNKEHYSDRRKADEWYDTIGPVLIRDCAGKDGAKCDDFMTPAKKLTEIYERMIR